MCANACACPRTSGYMRDIAVYVLLSVPVCVQLRSEKKNEYAMIDPLPILSLC